MTNDKTFNAAAVLLGIDPEDLALALKKESKPEVVEQTDLLTGNQISFRMSVSPRQVARWIAEGKMKALKLGRCCIRVPVSEYKKFLKLK